MVTGLTMNERGEQRVLVLSPYFAPETGAAPVRITAIADGLAALGWEVRVWTGMPNYPSGVIHREYRRALARREVRESGVEVVRIRTVSGAGRGLRRYLNFLSTALVCLMPLFSNWRPSVVIAEIPPPTQFVPAWLVARRFRASMVSSIADLWPETAVELGVIGRKSVLVRAAAALGGVVYSRSDHLVAITEGIAASLSLRNSRADISVIKNGVDLLLFGPGPIRGDLPSSVRFNGETPYVVYAGSLGSQSAAADVLVVLADKLSSDQIHVVVAGAGAGAQLISEAACSRENLHFTGNLPVEVVADLYRGCIAGIVTLADNGYFEGTIPAKLLPILGSGVPVLYSGSGEGARLVQRAGCGFVVSPNDHDALAEATRALAASDSLRRDLGAAGRAYAVEHLSWRQVAETWDQLLRTKSHPGT